MCGFVDLCTLSDSSRTDPGQLSDRSRTGSERIPDRSRTAPGQIPDRFRTDPGQTLDRFRTDPGKIPDTSWADPGQIADSFVVLFRFVDLSKLVVDCEGFFWLFVSDVVKSCCILNSVFVSEYLGCFVH